MEFSHLIVSSNWHENVSNNAEWIFFCEFFLCILISSVTVSK